MTRRKLIIFIITYILLNAQNTFAVEDTDFDIHAAVVTQYDDNITRDTEDERVDLINNVSVGIKLNKENKESRFNADGKLTQQIYSENTTFNNFSQDIKLDYEQDLSKRETFNVENKSYNTERPRSAEEEFGRTSGLYRMIGNEFEMYYTKETEKYRTLMFGFENEFYFVSGRDDIKDSFMNSFYFEQKQERDWQTTYLYRYDFSTRHFQDGDTFFINSVSGGLRRYFNKRMYMDVKIGLSLIHSYEEDTLIRPYALISMSNDINSKTKIQLSLIQESTANRSTEDIFDTWRMTSQIDYKLSNRVDIRGSAFYGQGEFQRSEVSDDLFDADIRFRYAFKKDIHPYLSYTYTAKDSNDDSRDFMNNVVTTGILFSF